ncbi:MAG: ATP-binding protein [Hoeflea sp.]|uniref:ATP-binding protein n=1 Tax=Hoeflea sp. TaxID=1940281 RepID=UPI003EFA6769
MPAHHYPFIELAVHAAVRDHFAKGDAVAVLSRDLGEVLWANGAAAQLFGFSNIYDILDEGFGSQTATRRQIESAVSGLGRTGKPQNFMMRVSSGFSRSMASATLEEFTLPDGVPAFLLTSSQAGQVLAPGARARQIIAGFKGTGTHVAVLDKDGQVLAATSTFGDIGLASTDIDRMVADVTGARDRLVKRMTASPIGAMPTAIGRLADDPALHLLFAVEPASTEEAATERMVETTPVAVDADSNVAGTDLIDKAQAESPAPDAPSENPDTLSENNDTAAPVSPGDTDAPTAKTEAKQTIAKATQQTDSAADTQGGRRLTFFDTRRIRDELNARLAKAEKESAVPAPFEDARGLVVPAIPEDASEGADSNQSEDSTIEAAVPADVTSDEPALITEQDAPAVTEDAVEDAESDELGVTAAVGAAPADETSEDPDLITGQDAPALTDDAAEDTASDAGSDELEDTAAGAAAADQTSEEAPLTTDEDEPAVSENAVEDIESDTHEEIAADATPAEEPAGPQFRFDPEGKPARFVWKINKDGEFSEVSPEFAAAVGPHSADIIGRKFPDLARVFNLDPDHVISDLLNRRDTWSGKTVFWPVQGTDLVTPVDLAALPTYTRDRRFDGFRGFGIVRTGETRKDPEALGLALVPGSISHSITHSPEAEDETVATEDAAEHLESSAVSGNDVPVIEDDADLETRSLESDIEHLARMDGVDGEPSGDANKAADADEATTAEPGVDVDDPFRGERPAIHLVETPMRRDSDKIIDLETRRPRLPRDGLSPGEQAAFREIGVRLTSSSTPQPGQQAETPDALEAKKARDVADASEKTAESAAPEIQQQTFGKRQASENDGQSDASDNGIRSGNGPAVNRNEPAKTGTDTDAAETLVAEIRADAASPADTAAAETLPSAFALPTRQAMPTGMTADVINAIPAALLVHSGDRLIHCNAEFFELTGYASLNELNDCGGLDHLLERPSEDDTSSDGGLFVRRGDGSRREITARLRSVNWADGQALLMALSPRENMRTEAPDTSSLSLVAETVDEPEGDVETPVQYSALEIEAQELRSILETATDGVVILNNDGTIRSMNGSACALFNYDENETHDQPFAMLFAHESQRAVMDYVSGLADHGVSSVLNDGREVIGREASGGFLPLFMTIGRLTGSNGYCAVLRDITNWKRTEEELRNAKRAAETANSHKSDFLARVSHEIRTPLNAIIGFSEMMSEERFGPIGSPRYLEYAHDIGNSGKHVLDIVNDLLDISKIEAGQVSMEFVSVSLNDHLAETVSLLQPMANSQRVIIRTSLSASVPEVVADQRSIKQIALNLLSNAIRYTPSGGQIVVSTSYEPSGNVIIRIRDTGIGMNRKELEHAMKPFGQVGPGARQRGDGTGLGLPLTKAMVEANRAQFDIVSTPGEGTLVSIAFPPQRVLAD